MNEEENQAFKVLHFYNSEDYGTEELKKYIKIIVNLVEKQQKEIEELKELLQGRLFESYKYYKDLASQYQGNCISKDKIKEKIEELLGE